VCNVVHKCIVIYLSQFGDIEEYFIYIPYRLSIIIYSILADYTSEDNRKEEIIDFEG